MNQKLSPLLRRCFSLNLPSTSSASCIDYTFSENVLKNSLPKIERFCQYYVQNANSDAANVKQVRKKIEKIRGEIHRGFRNVGVRLVPIGSASNHLLNGSSDLDLVFLPTTNEEEWRSFMKKFEHNTEFRKRYMYQIGDVIRKSKIGGNLKFFHLARIPIVRFMSHGLQVDIQFGNIGPIRSTLFIRTCVEFDERVALLIHWLTAKFHNSWLLNSSARLFSRYHVNLLVIHFLQAMPYPVLPDVMRLSPWLNEKNDWNDSVKVLTRQGSLYVPNVTEFPNEQSVGQLVIQIIDYYSQIDFEKCAIDTRGRVLERNPKDLNELQLNDEYFEESTCRVQNAPHILKTFFSDLKATVEQEDFEKLFS